jgi:hypothetical protein
MFSSLNYEKKYLKYKDKYQILKNQYGNILSGGDCNPLPDPEDTNLYGDSLLNLNPNERITIQNKCYDVKDLYEWIIVHDRFRLPLTHTVITPTERQNLIQAYQVLNVVDPSLVREDNDIITGENLHPSEQITIQNRCYSVRYLYEWIIVMGHNRLPAKLTLITFEERQRLIEAFQRLNNCNPLPDPRETDVITGENLLNLRPSERISIQNRCYSVRGLYQWIIGNNKNLLPATQTLITSEERQRLILAYRARPLLPGEKR